VGRLEVDVVRGRGGVRRLSAVVSVSAVRIIVARVQVEGRRQAEELNGGRGVAFALLHGQGGLVFVCGAAPRGGSRHLAQGHVAAGRGLGHVRQLWKDRQIGTC
jgi:hypothetical protein